MTGLNKALSFLARDYRMNVSYRLAFFMSFISIFASVATFFFVSKLFGRSISPYLTEYSGDYFSFVLIGIAFSGFAATGMRAFSNSITDAQAHGTLEAMLVTPTRLSSIIIFSSLWNFLMNSVNVFVYLAFGRLFFGLSLSRANLPAALVVLLLATFTFSGMGVLSASFIMVFKRGNPVDWLYGTMSGLFGGMFFPIKVLPALLQPVAYVLPIFYALRAMRLAVLKGYSIGALRGEISMLFIFAAVIIPVSVYAFKQAVRQAKEDGSLGTY